MTFQIQLHKELTFLNRFSSKNVLISTTAKEAIPFNVLPRRYIDDIGMSSFMINDETSLKQVIEFFDGLVDNIVVDIEQKQKIDLYKITAQHVKKSRLLTAKPNDVTVESVDLLCRNHFHDNLIEKHILIIGTGNLASKIATRLAERQGTVVIKGRTTEKEKAVTEALNLFLPTYTKRMIPFNEHKSDKPFDLVISALSGLITEEQDIIPHINEQSFIIDVGINNFSKTFIAQQLQKQTQMIRLDTRIAFPYLLLNNHQYTKRFFNDVCGMRRINNIDIVSGGYIGQSGAVIVDHLKNPNQIIGIADGSGGVKKDEQLTEQEREAIKTVEYDIETKF